MKRRVPTTPRWFGLFIILALGLPSASRCHPCSGGPAIPGGGDSQTRVHHPSEAVALSLALAPGIGCQVYDLAPFKSQRRFKNRATLALREGLLTPPPGSGPWRVIAGSSAPARAPVIFNLRPAGLEEASRSVRGEILRAFGGSRAGLEEPETYAQFRRRGGNDRKLVVPEWEGGDQPLEVKEVPPQGVLISWKDWDSFRAGKVPRTLVLALREEEGRADPYVVLQAAKGGPVLEKVEHRAQGRGLEFKRSDVQVGQRLAVWDPMSHWNRLEEGRVGDPIPERTGSTPDALIEVTEKGVILRPVAASAPLRLQVRSAGLEEVDLSEEQKKFLWQIEGPLMGTGLEEVRDRINVEQLADDISSLIQA